MPPVGASTDVPGFSSLSHPPLCRTTLPPVLFEIFNALKLSKKPNSYAALNIYFRSNKRIFFRSCCWILDKAWMLISINTVGLNGSKSNIINTFYFFAEKVLRKKNQKWDSVKNSNVLCIKMQKKCFWVDVYTCMCVSVYHVNFFLMSGAFSLQLLEETWCNFAWVYSRIQNLGVSFSSTAFVAKILFY